MSRSRYSLYGPTSGPGKSGSRSAMPCDTVAVQRPARVELNAALSLAERERTIARARLERTQTLVGVADRVAGLSLLAYREGASTLPVVLEAQRSARDTRTQSVEAMGALRTATARLRLLSLSSNGSR